MIVFIPSMPFRSTFAGLRLHLFGKQLPLAHRRAGDNESGRMQRGEGSYSPGGRA